MKQVGELGKSRQVLHTLGIFMVIEDHHSES